MSTRQRPAMRLWHFPDSPQTVCTFVAFVGIRAATVCCVDWENDDKHPGDTIKLYQGCSTLSLATAVFNFAQN